MQITLGVTGGVAAYKAAELVRRLQQEGFSVQVVMTRGAREFVTPLTFAALSGQKVITDLFGETSGTEANVESAIEHIAVAQRTDLLLVAPATADILAKFARGIANDFLTTLYLATTAPVVLAPAMNVNMWSHAATQENVERLRARGVKIVNPDEGYLACGMTGPGRLAGQEAIIAAVRQTLHAQRDLEGETILVSAGPTWEDLDPVRYLTNVPDEPVVWKDGLCGGGSGGAARRQGCAGERADIAGCARQSGAHQRKNGGRDAPRGHGAVCGVLDRDPGSGGGGLPAGRKACAENETQ